MVKRLDVTFQDLLDRGISKDDLTAEEICALVHACERVENPFEMMNAELMDAPIYVAKDLYIWRPTAGAVVWLTEYAERVLGKGSLYRWAQVYALLNARNSKAFVGLTTKSAIRRAVIGCALRFCVHSRELRRAVDLAYGVREWDAEDKRKKNKREQKARTDFGALVARLEVNSGIAKEAWLWGRSVFSLMTSYAELNELASAALGGGRHTAQFELDSAIQNLAVVVANITRRIREEREAKK